MTHSLKPVTLAAIAVIAMTVPFATAEAQNGYSYLFWPYFTAAPAPSQVRTPAQPQAAAAPAVIPVAAPRHAPPDFVRDAAEVRYAPPDLGRAYGSPQSVILGVGY